MPSYCAAYNCSNYLTKGCGLSFHRFPKNPELRQKWTAATKRKNFKPSDSTVLCSKHFMDVDFETGGIIKKLKKEAIPSIFDFPSYLQIDIRPTKKPRRVLFRHEAPKQCKNEANVQSNTPTDDNVNKNTLTPEASCSYTLNDALSTHSECDKPIHKTLSPTKTRLRREIKVLQQRLKRRDKKIKNMNDVINILKNKLNAPGRLVNLLEENFSGFPLELVMTTIKNGRLGKTNKQYSLKMQEFALTLYFYSPKAYKYFRGLNFCLPNPSTLRRWLSKFNCAPGLLSEVFEYLKVNVSVNENLKNVSLVYDCMSIRKQLIYDHNQGRNYGYVDFGGLQIVNHEELATEALVFQIVSLKQSFKCVVGYFFINKIDSSVLAQLIKVVIMKLNDIGIKVRNVTCDAPSTNLCALKSLGCKLPETPWFTLPTIKEKIYVILDACHMLKLCRNTLADKHSIVSKEGTISFKYIEHLNTVQNTEGYSFSNKLTDKHVNFHNRKMHVKTAAQTLSSSVADALQFLLNSNHPLFSGCEETIKFIRVIDRLFDIFNSRDPFGKHFKSPIRPSNKTFIDAFLKETKEYLSGLTIEGVPILRHPRKTFVLGFISNINSVIDLSTTLFNCEQFKYFLSYKLSQDHLEPFFSCIRAMGGNNNNPNVQQFKWAVRKLMFKNSVRPSDKSNCIEFDPYVQESVLSYQDAKCTVDEDDSDDDNSEFLLEIVRNTEISYYQNNILYYISGYIAFKLTKNISCEFCKNLLTVQNKSQKKPFMDFVSAIIWVSFFIPLMICSK